MAGKIHALLVGIDSYTNEDQAPTLNGCISDLRAVERFLLQHFTKDKCSDDFLKIRKLENQNATKDDLVRTFIAHLTNRDPINFLTDRRAEIEAGDTVLFYFSGHGSLSKSVFQNPDSELDLDETIVCHDSRTDGNFDLTDKELKFLLSLIPTGVQIVVIADSCHSGGIGKDTIEETRQIYLEAKKCPPNTRRATSRGACAYFFDPQQEYDLDKIKKLNKAKYLMIAACQANQYAIEKRSQGVFTNELIDQLVACKGITTFEALSESITRHFRICHPNQTPSFTRHNGFNMDQQFLVPALQEVS